MVKENEKEQLTFLESEFFKIVMSSKDKHFKKWKTKRTLPFVLLSEIETATLIARWMIEEKYEPGEDEKFNSEVHGCEIFLKPLLTFLTSEVERKYFDSLLQEHTGAIRDIANGKKLWDNGVQSTNMLKFKKFVQHAYLPLPCHTQFVEAGVKEAKSVSSTGREEKLRTQLAIIQNQTVGTFIENATEKIKHKVQGAKDHTPKVSTST